MWVWLSLAPWVVLLSLVLLVLFEPGLRYDVVAPEAPLDSDEFFMQLAALADAEPRGGELEVLTDAGAFYESELAAIRAAKVSIHLEAYIFRKGEVTRRVLDALTERARAGVKVRLVLDAFGNLLTRKSMFAELRAAGGLVAWYQPIRWSTGKRFNNRTHRELLVIDGLVGFIGGAGFADWWIGEAGAPPWRDTVVRVTGALATSLQAAFSENWLEAAGEILTGRACFPARDDDAGTTNGTSTGIVVISTPSAGRSTRARVLYQTLIASAKKSIRINSPYFVPDASTRRELVRAAARGVRVVVITPNERNNHAMTRLVSRRHYGELLRGAIEIREYQPRMIHAKVLVVDEAWCVLGSTNFDNRSFGLNDEVNLAVMNPIVAARLGEDFAKDLAESESITLEAWRRRSLLERVLANVGRVLERQA